MPLRRKTAPSSRMTAQQPAVALPPEISRSVCPAIMQTMNKAMCKANTRVGLVRARSSTQGNTVSADNKRMTNQGQAAGKDSPATGHRGVSQPQHPDCPQEGSQNG